MLADVPERRGAEQRVDDRVGEDVGIRVTFEPALVFETDAAQDQ